MSEDLKPCPWCGTQPKITPTNPELDGDGWARVLCVSKECKVRPEVKEFGNGHADSVNQAVAAWNRRAGQQGEARPAREEVERQVAELKKHVRRYATAYADYRAEVGFDGKEANFARLDALDADIDRLAAVATQAAPEAQAEQGERDTLRALLREAREVIDEARSYVDCASWSPSMAEECCSAIARIDAALADGGAK